MYSGSMIGCPVCHVNGANTTRASSQMISLISWRNFGWSATARKTWMFNELAERNTREEENGEISPRALHVKRKDLTSLFGRKDTMDRIISGGKCRNHGLCVAIPTRRLVKPLGVCQWVERCEVAKLRGEPFTQIKIKCCQGKAPRVNFLI